MQRDKFEQRKEDINNFIALLEYIDSIEVYKGVELKTSVATSTILVTSTHQKCMRSHAIMMLYNLVEATATECFLAIFDAINEERIKFYELDNSLQQQWLRSKMDNGDSMKKRVEKTKTIIKQIELDISFEYPQKMFNGNVDIRNICDVCKDYKLQLTNIPNKEKAAATLKRIKDIRNSLAHGSTSYSDFGATVVLSDIKRYTKDTFEFLTFFMDKVETYITEKRYKIVS